MPTSSTHRQLLAEHMRPIVEVMNTIRTTSRHLSDIFERDVSMFHLAEPLETVDAEVDVGAAREIAEAKDFDELGVRVSGSVVGRVRLLDLTEGKVRDHTHGFDVVNLISDTAPLASALSKFTDSSILYVLTPEGVTHIVTRGDLQKTPVRMMLFGLISMVEMRLADFIDLYYPNESWIGRDLLSSDRLSQARGIWTLRKRRNEAISLSQCLQFADKKTLLRKHDNFSKQVGWSKNSFSTLLKKLERIRNLVAHSQDLVGDSDWREVIETTQSARRFLADCEKLLRTSIENPSMNVA